MLMPENSVKKLISLKKKPILLKYCLVFDLTTTITDDKWAAKWPLIFATSYVSFATNFYSREQVHAVSTCQNF